MTFRAQFHTFFKAPFRSTLASKSEELRSVFTVHVSSHALQSHPNSEPEFPGDLDAHERWPLVPFFRRFSEPLFRAYWLLTSEETRSVLHGHAHYHVPRIDSHRGTEAP